MFVRALHLEICQRRAWLGAERARRVLAGCGPACTMPAAPVAPAMVSLPSPTCPTNFLVAVPAPRAVQESSEEEESSDEDEEAGEWGFI